MNHRRRENGAQNIACAGKGRFFPWVSALCIFFLTASPLSAAVLPSGGNVTRGSGTVSETDTDMTITQTTDKMIIEWQDFSIGEGKSVTFDQPSRGAAALNRVIGSQVSEIRGALKANGRVFLVNPNGVLFGRTAQVNVGDLVVSTLDISDEDFLEGNYSFEGDSPGSIVNGGDIEAAPGGSVVMIAARIENAGTITAPEGNVLMGAGRRVLLDLGGPVKLEVKEAAVDALIEQGGAISADGGLIYISAEAAGDLQSTVINHTGVTEAKTLVTGEQGGIYLMGGMNNDRIEVGGTLDASAPEGGDGGFVETSAAEVKAKEGAKVRAGHWLIDPTDVTIDETMANSLEGQLGTGDATVTTEETGEEAGDINVEAAISWSANRLTLSAHNDININDVMTATVSAGLEMNTGTEGNINCGFAPGDAGGFRGKVNLESTTTLVINGDSYTIIKALGEAGSTTGTDLQGMSGNPSGNYALGSDINASATAEWNSDGNEGFYGFDPIGNGTNHFTGTFDGLGHVITDLYINRPDENNVGLFGYNKGATIKNVGLKEINIQGALYTGSLVGQNENSAITRCFTEGAIVGTKGYVGGLVGENSNSSISYSYAAAKIKATGASDNQIENIGGLVGHNEGGSINYSYASGAVIPGDFCDNVGGLVGENSYINTGPGITNPGIISNSYATGEVKGWFYVGGLVGYNYDSSIDKSYAIGKVDGEYFGGEPVEGGLVGKNIDGDISLSYWNTETTGLDTSAGGTGMTTKELMTLSIFTDAGWDISANGGEDTAWRIYDRYTYPLLRAFLTPVTATNVKESVTKQEKEYDGNNLFPGNYFDWDVEVNEEKVLYGTTGKDVGEYDIVAFSVQDGYDITSTITDPPGAKIIPKELSLVPAVEDKTYDGTKDAAIIDYGLTGLVEGESLELTGTAAFADKNAAEDKTVYITGIGLSEGGTGDLASNYSLAETTSETTASIFPRQLYVGEVGINDKTYDGMTAAYVNNYQLFNLVGDETVTAEFTADFADKNVGEGKEVTITDITLFDGANGGLASNYVVVFPVIGPMPKTRMKQPPAITASILRRLVEVAADPKAKEEGQADPALTYQVEAQQGDRGLVAGETLAGFLTREAGEAPGIYEILQGNLHNANNPNYDIWYTPADFTITEADTGLPEPVQDAVSTSKQDISNSRKATTALVSRYRESVRDELWGDQSDQDGEGGSPDTGGGQRHWTLSLGEFLKLRIANRGIRFPEWMDAE